VAECFLVSPGVGQKSDIKKHHKQTLQDFATIIFFIFRTSIQGNYQRNLSNCPGHAMLMSANKDETTVPSSLSVARTPQVYVAVHIYKVLVEPQR